MQYLHPNVLWALLALAVPVIIHLFYFRRYKKVYFNNVRFLQSIQEEKKISKRLRNLLVLLSRLAALVFLILAFAQPFLSKDNVASNEKQKIVGIYIDNSPSMAALGKKTNLLNTAQNYADAIISSSDISTQFLIVNNGRDVNYRKLLTADQAQEAIDRIKPVYAQRTLDQVYSFFQSESNRAQGDRQKELYIVSDFQSSFVQDLEILGQDSSIAVFLVPISAVEKANVSVDSCWFESPKALVGERQELYTRITNHGKNEVQTSLELVLNDRIIPLGQLNIPPNSSIVDSSTISIPSDDWQVAHLAIQDFPINFDDRLFFSFKPLDRIRVTSIHETVQNKYLRAGLSDDSFFEYTPQAIGGVDYSALLGQDLVILDHLKELNEGLATELRKYLEAGGSLCVFLAKGMDDEELSRFGNLLGLRLGSWVDSEQEVHDYKESDFVFDNLFFKDNNRIEFPEVMGYYSVSSVGYAEELMRLRNGAGFLIKTEPYEGNSYTYTSPLDLEINKLPNFPQFLVPVLYKMGLSARSGEKMVYYAGDNDVLRFAVPEESYETPISLRGGDQEVIPFQSDNQGFKQLYLSGLTLKPHNYDVVLGPKRIASIGMNIDRAESVLEFVSPESIQADHTHVQVIQVDNEAKLLATIKDVSKGPPWWRYCLILALMFLGIEMIILNFWKN